MTELTEDLKETWFKTEKGKKNVVSHFKGDRFLKGKHELK